MDSKNLIGGLLAGTAIGVAIGMLVAPSRGEKTQRKLSKNARMLSQNLKGGIVESASRLKKNVKEGVEEVSKEVKR